jgi:hypothetical protein
MVFDNKVYDALKWIASYLLPGLATLWLALGKIWNLPLTSEIGATISAIDFFLAGLLGISSKNYTGDGDLLINTANKDGNSVLVALNNPIEDIKNKKTVTFIVKSDDNG